MVPVRIVEAAASAKGTGTMILGYYYSVSCPEAGIEMASAGQMLPSARSTRL